MTKKQSKYPFISVITPSLNQAKFIEEAIESVLKQNYPNFEHIIVDGASTDGTLKILKRYKHLKWISEPDESYIEAVNKGIKMSFGEIIGVLNTDDYYEPGAFHTVAKILDDSKDIFVVVGNCNIVNEKGKLIRVNKPKVKFEQMLQPWRYQFPYNASAYFYYKDIHEIIGMYNVKSGVSYDYEFLLRLAKKYKLYYVNKILGNFRYYQGTETFNNRENNLNDQIRIGRPYWGNIFSLSFYRYFISYLNFRFPLILQNIIAFLRKKIALRTRIRRFLSR